MVDDDDDEEQQLVDPLPPNWPGSSVRPSTLCSADSPFMEHGEDAAMAAGAAIGAADDAAAAEVGGSRNDNDDNNGSDSDSSSDAYFEFGSVEARSDPNPNRNLPQRRLYRRQVWEGSDRAKPSKGARDPTSC